MLVFPNAKINIGLRVVERRSDGFHNLETLFYPVYGLFDVLEMVESKEFSFEVLGCEIEGSVEDNLVVRAYRLLQAEFELPTLSFYLKKAIPMGAGMGGGSADATFTLKALNNMFSLGLSAEKLAGYASRLGSDCSFFAYNKPMFARGKGEILTPAPLDLSGKFLLLVKPPVAISTREAYAGVRPMKPEVAMEEILHRPVSEWREFVRNDFEDSIFEKHPVLAEIKAEMYNGGALYAAMSGSGSTIYGIFDHSPEPLFPNTDFYKKVVTL